MAANRHDRFRIGTRDPGGGMVAGAKCLLDHEQERPREVPIGQLDGAGAGA